MTYTEFVYSAYVNKVNDACIKYNAAGIKFIHLREDDFSSSQCTRNKGGLDS